MTATIGQQLRTAREARGLSLLDVEKTIHIRVHYLQALEDDDFSRMPSKTQARGFLRLYADFLKIPSISTSEPEGESPDGLIPAAAITAVAPPQAAPDRMETTTQSPPKESRKKPSQEREIPESGTQPLASDVSRMDSPATGGENALAYFAIYHEIGDQLCQRRESLSLSLDDISLHTRIKREYLETIEDGRLDDLPSPVQGRGMISNYAEFLNLDSDALLSRFADALQLKRLELLPPQEKSEKPAGDGSEETNFLQKVSASAPVQSVSRFLTPDLLIGGSLALLLVILIIWGAVQVIKPPAAEPKGTAPSISEMLLSTPTVDPRFASTPDSAANTALPAEGSTQEPEAQTTLPAIPLEGTLAFNQGSQPIQVYVIANQPAFLKVSEDGSVKFLGRIIAGNAYQFSGYNKVELLTGNGAAMQVIYNETDLGILGEPGSVIRLVFTREGYATPTPAQPATPTNTRQPTLTIQPSVTPTVTPYVP